MNGLDKEIASVFEKKSENKKDVKDLLEKADLKDIFILSEILNNPFFER